MTVTAAVQTPKHRARAVKLWGALVLLIAAGIGLAFLGAGQLRGQTTDSGVYIRTLEEGSGPTVQPVDGVLIEYEGRLKDGTVFDSSASHGGPQAMIAGQSIPGFSEALSHMRAGGRYVIRIPSQLAYGATPPPGLPANADLEFDVHLVEVAPNAGLTMGLPQRPRQ